MAQVSEELIPARLGQKAGPANPWVRRGVALGLLAALALFLILLFRPQGLFGKKVEG